MIEFHGKSLLRTMAHLLFAFTYDWSFTYCTSTFRWKLCNLSIEGILISHVWSLERESSKWSKSRCSEHLCVQFVQSKWDMNLGTQRQVSMSVLHPIQWVRHSEGYYNWYCDKEKLRIGRCRLGHNQTAKVNQWLVGRSDSSWSGLTPLMNVGDAADLAHERRRLGFDLVVIGGRDVALQPVENQDVE